MVEKDSGGPGELFEVIAESNHREIYEIKYHYIFYGL